MACLRSASFFAGEVNAEADAAIDWASVKGSKPESISIGVL